MRLDAQSHTPDLSPPVRDELQEAWAVVLWLADFLHVNENDCGESTSDRDGKSANRLRELMGPFGDIGDGVMGLYSTPPGGDG